MKIGIAITGGEGPPPQALKRLIDSSLGEMLLAAADSGLILAEAAGLKADWVIGDMDSLSSEERLRSYPAAFCRQSVGRGRRFL